MTSKKYQSRNRDIYCGFDDSNHASQNPKSEIIVGVFSENRSDFISERQATRRNMTLISNYLEGSARTYLFTQLPKDKMFNRHFNLPLVAPFFMDEYLQRFPGKMSPTSITLGFDGMIYKKWKNVLKQDFSEEYGLDVNVEYFTGKTKRVCPFPVYSADAISNWLFGLSFGEIVMDRDEMFNISLEELAERYKLFR